MSLEPLSDGHVEGLRRCAADPRIWPYMPLDAGTPAGFDRMIGEARAALALGTALPFAVRRLSDGAIVGATRYLDIRPADGNLEIGWTWYAPEAWGTAVNPEAKLLLLAHAFEGLGAVRVALCCDARNRRSHDAILRLGATREGVLRRHRLVQHGVIRDTVVFSILDDEWPRVKAGLEARLALAAGAPVG